MLWFKESPTIRLFVVVGADSVINGHYGTKALTLRSLVPFSDVLPYLFVHLYTVNVVVIFFLGVAAF